MNAHLVPKVEPGALANHGPMDYVSRFLFGAGISLAAGLIGMKFGPVVGGVFLGFPAILPASLTLIEERTIGPGLGQDSIRHGEIASAVGAALVVTLMLAVYGLFADMRSPSTWR